MADPTKYYPFTDLVDMSPDAIERRVKEVFQMNSLCAWLAQAEPVETEERIAEDPPAYGKPEEHGKH